MHYVVDARRTAAHTYQVVVQDHIDGTTRYFLPSWAPGFYKTQDAIRNLTQVHARGCTLSRDGLHGFVAEGAGEIEISYEIYAREFATQGAYLDDERGFFNAIRLLLCREDAGPLTLELLCPDPFDVATTLPLVGAHYHARDYHELVDNPVLFGSLERVPFLAGDVEHELVLSGAHRSDPERLATDLSAICAEAAAVFDDDELPFSRYLFLTTVLLRGYGGLEHKSCTHLLTSKWSLPHRRQEGMNERYRTFLGLCSHEYFHAWLVKRIRPKVIAEADYQTPALIDDLWLYEGFTSYYDDLILVRSGVIDHHAYLELLSKQLTRVLQTPGHRVRSAAEASRDTWLFMHKPPENTSNVTVSYYAKGAWIALALDLKIRLTSAGARSLDDVMRALWRRRHTPLSTEDIWSCLEEGSGMSLDAFRRRYVEGTALPPLADDLAAFGITLLARPRTTVDDKGGGAGKKDDRLLAAFGVRFFSSSSKIAVVEAASPAWRAGLAVGDELVAVDGQRANRAQLANVLRRYEPGETVRVHHFRDGRLRETDVLLAEAAEDTLSMHMVDEVDEALIRRERWLNARP